MPWASHPGAASSSPALDFVCSTLDPVLMPLGFAPGPAGASNGEGQVIFCRGEIDSEDGGCVDLVVGLEAAPEWRVVEVRYWGFPSERWQLDFDRDAPLPDQVLGLAQRLPEQLA